MYLTPQEAAAVDARIARVEACTGVQVVTAVTGKSDGYPEVVWKAFALGVAVTALIVVALDVVRPDWVTAHYTWFNVMPILAVGVVSALLAIAVPEYARLFLNRVRAAGEVRQYAQAMFLERQLFRTRARCGVLVLASLFERHVEIVADLAFDARVDSAEWGSVVDAMTPALRAGRTADAFMQALDRIETMLVDKGFAADPGVDNELANQPIETDGER
ncbi:MAG TPA: TPM domain-containing protein [Casimicrobiaceae bacterium]|nr:TPM domain-containing protein [Casimicrobiaceae bacterium]